jgi:threonine dehydrogenase-like Zn-dependent dehydrogenase
MQAELPSSHRALVLESVEAGFHVTQLPTPKPEPGSAIVQISAASILTYHREIYSQIRPYDFPTPLTGGVSAVGRVVAVGPDSTALKPGQLVFADCVIHSRDDPDALFLTAIHEGTSDGSKKLIRDVWRHGMWAEYARIPLENCLPLNESILCRSLGYSIPDLAYLGYLTVSFGGLRDIRLEAGETVIIAPATGGFGGAGVLVAVAMGARVIAMGRNETELARLKTHVLKNLPWASIETVQMTGDEDKDAAALQAFGTVDAVLDFSPPAASKSSHVRSAARALRRGGRVSLMGFCDNPMTPQVIARNISFKGKLMYEREDLVLFIKMLERGLFPKGKELVDSKAFDLKDWKNGMDTAAEYFGVSRHVIFVP